jgi:hypothetical protein
MSINNWEYASLPRKFFGVLQNFGTWIGGKNGMSPVQTSAGFIFHGLDQRAGKFAEAPVTLLVGRRKAPILGAILHLRSVTSGVCMDLAACQSTGGRRRAISP